MPLRAEDFPCPYCQNIVSPPEEYRHSARLRKLAVLELRRAEELWRRSRWTSAPPFVLAARVVTVLWFLAVGVAAIGLSGDWPVAVVWLAGLLTVVQLFIGLSLATTLAEQRALLPSLPSPEELDCPAAGGKCQECAAPIEFEQGRFAAMCLYCGADTYRAALDRKQAATKANEARGPLRELAGVARARRREVLSAFGFLAVAEVFYAVLLAAWTAVAG